MLKRVVSGMMLMLLLVGMLTFAVSIPQTNAKIIIVPDNYPTIQQAVDAAESGDTILVRAGTYDEDVVINGKSISLIGESASNTTIRGLGRAG